MTRRKRRGIMPGLVSKVNKISLLMKRLSGNRLRKGRRKSLLDMKRS